MPMTETVLNVFVASPDDMSDGRVRLHEVVDELNRTWRQNLGISLDLISSETHAYPGVGTDAQDVINEQIGDNYDIFIGMMWKRFGTPTGRAGSGTEEEFERAYARFKENPDQVRVMFYFKDAPIEPSQIDPEQLALIREFQKKTRRERNSVLDL